MDFWTRLLAHTPLSSGSSRKDAARDPIRRLHRFEKEYGQILQIWRNSSNLASDVDAAEAIEVRLKELTNILADESRRPLPHPCIAFAASKQVYSPIAIIATTSYSEWIIKQAVHFFATLIESEEEAFEENDAFATSLTNLLVRITGTNSIRLSSDTEVRVVELAFNITTKIRLDPSILPAWFKSRQQLQQRQQRLQQSSPGGPSEKQQEGHDKFAGKTQKQDFPLFYLLIDYIHHEGKLGDFARTGLLYIIESASSSVPLEQWIVESDLSTLMATGLGALYSQLSRKLVIDHPTNNLPPVLALSDYEHPKSTYEIVSSCSPEFQAHLETFLSHLLFWQDVLNHCRSVEVKQTLLEHFQVIFLQQLLYPSLLESSDIDGGSSVAVLTYLRRILESLDHPDMINLILHYLLALPDKMASGPATTRNSVSAARKRKSMDLATMMAAKAEVTATPLLFNLVDLMLSGLRSHSHQTIHVTLQLISAILKRHHRYATMTLIHTEGVHSEARRRTIGAHHQEVEFFISLAGTIGGQDNFNEVYEDVLRDTVVRLESHPCSLKLVAPRTSTNNHELPAIPDSLPGAPQDVHLHTIRQDDPLLGSLLDLLETFLVNPVDTNLSVTETLFDLAVCGFMSVEGWMLRHPDKYIFDDDDNEYEVEDGKDGLPGAIQPPMSPTSMDPESAEFLERQRVAAMKQCKRRPRWAASSLPRLTTVLQTLVDQVEAYRETVPRFDDLLQQRREAFQTAESGGAEPASVRPPVPATASPLVGSGGGGEQRYSSDDPRSASPARPSALEGFAQRILSELGTPSRSGSPRGRKERERERERKESERGDVMYRSSGTAAKGVGGEGFASPSPAAASATMSGGYGFATPTSSKPICIVPPGGGPAPREFPISYDTSIKGGGGVGGGIARSYSPAASVPGGGGGSQRAGSPALSDGRDPAIQSQVEAFKAVDQKILARRVALPVRRRSAAPIPLRLGGRLGEEGPPKQQANGGDAAAPASEESRELSPPPPEHQEEKMVSVSHVLTNVIILQSFLFELASLVQVRAGLFDEVRFV